jgi:hypothetical protein
MLKKSIILPVLLLFSVLLHGQNSNVKITVGQPYKVIDAWDKEYFYDNDEIMSIKLVDDNLLIIQKFNSDLTFIQQSEYKDMPEDASILKYDKYGDHYYLFYSLWDEANLKEELFYRKINFSKGILENENVKLISVDGKANGFSFRHSKNRSKLLIKYRLKPDIIDDSKSFDVIGMYAFDESLNKLWNKEVTMPYTEKKMNNIDYSIDAEGSAYILTSVYDDDTTDEKKSKNGDPNYHFELFRIKANTVEIEKTTVTLNDKFISKISLLEMSEKYMVCTGFYSNGNVGGNADGIFTFKIKKDGIAFDMITHEIPLEILNQYEDNKTIRKNNKEVDAEYRFLSFDFVRFSADDGIILGGEQHYIKSRASSSTVIETDYYQDILVVRLDNEGDLKWIKKIPKRQAGRLGLGSLSFNYVMNKNEHYFTFLDNEKNENLSTDRVPAVYADRAEGQLITYKVSDSTGDIERIVLFNTNNVNGMSVYQLKPTRIIKSGESELIIEVYKKKKEDVLIKLEF